MAMHNPPRPGGIVRAAVPGAARLDRDGRRDGRLGVTRQALSGPRERESRDLGRHGHPPVESLRLEPESLARDADAYDLWQARDRRPRSRCTASSPPSVTTHSSASEPFPGSPVASPPSDAAILHARAVASDRGDGHARPRPRDAEPPSLLVLNLELVDSSGEVTDQRADHDRRLAAVRETLASELAARDVYDVVDPAEIQAEIDATRERQYLHACNGCEIRFARAGRRRPRADRPCAQGELAGHGPVGRHQGCRQRPPGGAQGARFSRRQRPRLAARGALPGAASWSSCRRTRAEP